MKKDYSEQHLFINREKSWLDFNERVLLQALDTRTPPLEQAKFSAIFSNNLDEFFMVRVASLKSQVEAGITKKSEDGQSASNQLNNIRLQILSLIKKQQNHYLIDLKKRLTKEKVYILDYEELTPKQCLWVNKYFEKSIFPVLTPLAVDPAHPFPFVSNLSLNLAVLICDPHTKQKQFARIKVPRKTMERLIPIPTSLNQRDPQSLYTAIPIEQIVAANLKLLFPGMEIVEHYLFRVTRDADLALRDIEADDLMSALEEGLRKRRTGGEIVRLEVSKQMPKELSNLLLKSMGLEKDDLYQIDGLLGMDELFSLSTLPFEQIKFKPHKGLTPVILQKSQQCLLGQKSHDEYKFESIFSIIQRKDILLMHPYDLFDSSVEEFINQAADDPLVMAIKMTLYRISKDSAIIKALIRAVENGKQVMALVELQARFDEDNNIQWARHLEQSGVHVVYGVLGLKTHTKITLVVRKENSNLQSYVHIGTGNYNSKSAKNYTDLGLLSADPELGKDLVQLFNYLTGFSKQQSFRKLLVAPVTLRKGIESLIDREIDHAKNGRTGHIRAKLNSLVDSSIINKLYKASNAGVKIELIIRGMCCLYPNKAGLSENIRVISIIGRFLEHSRIFWFGNHEESEVYIGSADWMRRNLDRRVEAVTPIHDKDLKKKLEGLLELYLDDNRGAWEMQNDGSYVQRHPNETEICSQTQLIELWDKDISKV